MKRVLLPILLAIGALSFAQGPKTPPKAGEGTLADWVKVEGVNWHANIGSIKLPNGKGRTILDFEGTCLLANVEGTVVPSGSLKLEYNSDKMKRKTYFGKGRIVVEGKWTGIAVFGKNLSGKFNGYGFMYLTGEFDKDLKTGEYWYDSSPNRKMPWMTSMITLILPPDPRLNPKPRVRGSGG